MVLILTVNRINYSATYNEMYGTNMGYIYNNDKSYKNIPYIVKQDEKVFYFMNEDEKVEELINFSAFGKGVFKISDYILIYNVGTEGRPVSLSEIVSLDEKYNNLFEFNKQKYNSLVEDNEDFILVSSSNYDDGLNYISTDYFYVSKDNTTKVFLFNSDKYSYKIKSIINENEFILYTDEVKEESIKCIITELGVDIEKIIENNNYYSLIWPL